MLTEITKQTGEVLAHHLQALGGGDLEGVLSDYTEESILFLQQGPVRGLAGLRAFFDASIKNSPPEMMQAFQMVRMDVDGEIAFIVWKAEPFVKMGSDTFVIRSGKIAAQTLVAS